MENLEKREVIGNYYISNIKHIIYIILFLISFQGVGQNKNYSVDPLLLNLNNATSHSDKIIALNDLGAYYEGVSNYPKSIAYLAVALQLNNDTLLPEQLILTCNYMGYDYWHKSEYDSALFYHKKALEIAVKHNIKNGYLAFTYLMLGNDYYDKGDFSKTSSYYFKSLKLAELIQNKDIQVQCHNRLSKLYYKMKDYPQSTTHVLQAITLNLNNNTREFGVSYNSFGNLALIESNLDSALYYFNHTLLNFQQCGDVIGQSIASINLGDTYLALNGKNEVPTFLDSSYHFYQLSFMLNKKVDNQFGMIYGLWGMADVEMQSNNTQAALKNYRDALNISIKIGAKSEELNLYNKLHFLYDLKGNKDSSLAFLKKHIALKNEVESTTQTKQLLRQESKYEAEKLIASEKADSEKKRLIQKEKNKWKNIFIGLVILAIIILFYVSYHSIKRLKTIRIKNNIINKINDELSAQKQEITDSISYASRIQNAILPSDEFIKECLPNSAVYYKPKDIVAGDFYWIEKVDNKVIFAVADCTGHGVPGAMMSVICSNALSSAVKEHELHTPEKILNKVNALIQDRLYNKEETVRDGMDITLCVWDKDTNKLKFSGAFNSLYYCRNNELNIVKADRMPVGKYVQSDKKFTLHELDLMTGDTLYLHTDGFTDQFGGEKGKKFKSKAFRKLLLSIQNKAMEEQKTILDETFKTWKGDLEQIDDVCVLGVRI